MGLPSAAKSSVIAQRPCPSSAGAVTLERSAFFASIACRMPATFCASASGTAVPYMSICASQSGQFSARWAVPSASRPAPAFQDAPPLSVTRISIWLSLSVRPSISIGCFSAESGFGSGFIGGFEVFGPAGEAEPQAARVRAISVARIRDISILLERDSIQRKGAPVLRQTKKLHTGGASVRLRGAVGMADAGARLVAREASPGIELLDREDDAMMADLPDRKPPLEQPQRFAEDALAELVVAERQED